MLCTIYCKSYILWKGSRGLAECSKCRLCGQQRETVEHLLPGCKVLANSEYLTRHNRAFWSEEAWMVFLIYSKILRSLRFFMENSIPLKHEKFIEHLI